MVNKASLQADGKDYLATPAQAVGSATPTETGIKKAMADMMPQNFPSQAVSMPNDDHADASVHRYHESDPPKPAEDDQDPDNNSSEDEDHVQPGHIDATSSGKLDQGLSHPQRFRAAFIHAAMNSKRPSQQQDSQFRVPGSDHEIPSMLGNVANERLGEHSGRKGGGDTSIDISGNGIGDSDADSVHRAEDSGLAETGRVIRVAEPGKAIATGQRQPGNGKGHHDQFENVGHVGVDAQDGSDGVITKERDSDSASFGIGNPIGSVSGGSDRGKNLQQDSISEASPNMTYHDVSPLRSGIIALIFGMRSPTTAEATHYKVSASRISAPEHQNFNAGKSASPAGNTNLDSASTFDDELISEVTGESDSSVPVESSGRTQTHQVKGEARLHSNNGQSIQASCERQYVAIGSITSWWILVFTLYM